MDISVKDLMDCVDLDLSDDQSVLRRLFGFRRSLVPPDPTGVTASVSVRQLADGIDGDHVHLNVIRVGFDDFNDDDEDDALIDIDYSIYRIRNIYRPQNVGVGRVKHYVVEGDSDADDFADIDDVDEAEDLWQSYYVDNDGIDAFVVRTISGFLGYSPVGGDCGKQSSDDGLLGGDVGNNPEGMSRTFAHEVGHFLGLPHNHNALPDGPCPATTAGQNNLMAQTGCTPRLPDGISAETRFSVLLTNTQGNTMDDHCTIQGACS